MFHLTTDLIVLITAIIVGLLTLRKSHPLYLKLLPFFLMLILGVELYGELHQKEGQNNIFIFNLLSVAEFFFFNFFFYQVIPVISTRKSINTIGLVLIACCLLNIFFLQGKYVFHTYTYIAGCLAMVTFGVIYFYQLFNSQTRLNLLREPSFWINIGIIFFFVSSVSVIGTLNYISIMPKAIRINLKQILLLVNAFFYLTFIFAFLCKINIRKS
jgi:hypothetical protein